MNCKSTITKHNYFKSLLLTMAVVLFSWLAMNAWGQTTVPFTTSDTWTVPCGVTEVTIEAIGGGGGGGGVYEESFKASAGGGGGAYAKSTVNVTAGEVLTITVGDGGSSLYISSAPGGESKVSRGSTTLVKAVGGGGVTYTITGYTAFSNEPKGYATGVGTGGQASQCIGDIAYSGGNGGLGNSSSSRTGNNGGGGGGAAGRTGNGGNGGNASSSSIGAAGTGNSPGGNGAAGASVGNDGNSGATYGGGGSGAARGTRGSQSGGAGAKGVVYITYTTCTVSQAQRTAPTSIIGNSQVCQGNDVSLSATGGTGGNDEILWKEGSCPSVAYIQDFVQAPTSTSNITSCCVSEDAVLQVSPANTDPMIHMYDLGNFDYTKYKYFQIRYRVPSGNAGSAQVFFRNNVSDLSEERSVSGPLINDGEWHVLTLNAGANSNWNSNVTGWRFDPTNTQVTVEIDYIALTDAPQTGESTTFTIPTAGAHTYYAARINNSGASCISKTVTVYPQFDAGAISATGETICYDGTPAAIGTTTAASGGDGNFFYRWYKGATLISGATGATYTPTETAAGSYTYTRQAKDGSCSNWINSTGTYTLTIRPRFNAGAIATAGETICYGEAPAAIGSTTTASGGDGNISYQWYNGSSEIPGATDATYTPSTELAPGTYTFTRKAKDNTCVSLTASTGSYTLTVIPLPTLSDPANKTQTVCSGSAIQEIVFTSENATSLSATSLPAGLTLSNNKISGTPTASGTYTVTTQNDYGCENTSRQGTISIIPAITLINGVTDRGNIANCYTIDPEDNFVNKEGDIVSYPALTEYGDTVRGCSCDVLVTLNYRTPTTASVQGRVRLFEPTTASHAYAYTTADCSGTPIEASSLSVNGKFVTAVFSGLSENTKYYFKILATNGTKQAEGVSEAY